MIYNTVCPHCKSALEVQAEFANDRTMCPNCEKLFVPSDPANRPAPRVQTAPTPAPDRAWVFPMIVVVASLAIAGTVVFSYQRLSLESVVGGAAGGLALALAVFFVFVAVLWFVFPVFVYYGLRRMERLLRQIEQNTRR